MKPKINVYPTRRIRFSLYKVFLKYIVPQAYYFGVVKIPRCERKFVPVYGTVYFQYVYYWKINL